MATNKALQFIKTRHYDGSELTTNWSTNLAKEGALIYATDSHELWIGGATPVCVVKGTTNVDYNSTSKMLTITASNASGAETTKTLDFSDVASGSATLQVFEKVYEVIGTTTTSGHEALDYSNTNYLADLGTTGEPAKNLVNADKALDAEIKRLSDAVGGNSVVNSLGGQRGVIGVGNGLTVTSTTVGDVTTKTLNLVPETNGYIVTSQNSATGINIDSSKVDSTYITNGTVNTGTNIATVATVTAGLATLDVNGYAEASIAATAGENPTTSDLKIKGIKEVDGKIENDSTYDLTVKVDGVYNASTNMIATESTVSDAIAGLDTTNDVSLWTGAAYTPSTGENATYTYTVKKVAEENGIVKAGTATDSTLYLKRAQSAANPIVTMDDLSGVTGAMVYRDSVTRGETSWTFCSTTPTTVDKGDVYVVSTGFTLNAATALLGHNIPAGSYEAGDMFIYNGSDWTTINGENQVTNSAATIAVGDTNFTTLATVDGTNITAKVSAAASAVTTVAITDGAATNPSTLYAASNVQAVLEDVARKSNSALQSVSGTLANTTPTGSETAYDPSYVFIMAGNKDANNNQDLSVYLTKADVRNRYPDGQGGWLVGNQYVYPSRYGVLTTSDLGALKNYVDYQAEHAADSLDSVADADTASGSGFATMNITTPSSDFNVLNSITETNGKLASGDAYQLKKLAATGAATDMTVTSATYGGAGNTTNAQTALNNLASAISSAAITIDGQVGAIHTGDGITTVTANSKYIGINIDSTNPNGLYLDSTNKSLAMHKATGDQFGTVKVTSGNGLSLSNGVVSYAHNTTAITVASKDTTTNVVTINGTLTPDASDAITASNAINLAAVAATGAAANVSIADSGSNFTATDVEGALAELKNDIAGLDSIADADTASGTGYATVTTTTPSADFKVLNSITETDGKLVSGDAYQLKKLAATGAAADVTTAAFTVGPSGTDTQTTINASNVQSMIESIEARLYWEVYE